MLAEPRSPAAEAYRSLAATLQFAYADRQLQTIGVTSAAAGEGKSTHHWPTWRSPWPKAAAG